METIAVWLLLSISSILGVVPTPADFKTNWTVDMDWKKTADGFAFKAHSNTVGKLCENNVHSAILFPRVIHSANRVTVDGHVIFEQGDFNFRNASPFYEQAVVSCAFFKPSSVVEWEVTSYSQYFARFAGTPKLNDGYVFRRVANVDANLISAAVLIVLSILSLFLFTGRISKYLLISISFGSLVSAGYFLNCANSRIGISLTMLDSHKVADICLWIGVYFFFYGFYIESLLPKWIIATFGVVVMAANTVILFGSNGTQVQLGTVIPMLPYLIIFLVCSKNLIRTMRGSGTNLQGYIRLFSLMSYFLAGVNDLATTAGLFDGNLVFSFGIVFGYFGMAVAVNRDIDKTYQERDALLTNLEAKVLDKTKHLQEALSTLKTTQAELVQSAKLASLGTLSAGVAHEINNSINYVSGALRPLEKKIKLLIPEQDQHQVNKLLDAIKEGTSLTVGIVNSLRVYTGLNQAAFKEFAIQDVVHSSLTILKSKTKNVEITVNVDPQCRMNGSVVGIGQIIMNLVTNALDALPSEGGRIEINAKLMGADVELSVADNGSGIPKDLVDRIFEPFFTTKEVGKGTGLGLHIVLKEVERHLGKISIQSEPTKGTKFIITFPTEIRSLKEAA